MEIIFYGLLALLLFFGGRKRVQAMAGPKRPRSRPHYYGLYLVLTTFIPLFIATIGCGIFGCFHVHLTETVTLQPLMGFVFGLVGFLYGWRRMDPTFPALKKIESLIRKILFIIAATAVLITFSIFTSMIIESMRFFHHIPVVNFLFGTDWSPHALSDVHKGHYGALPLFTGTLLITLIAMGIAGPLGILSAIYLSQYASPRFKMIARPLLEILAGVPTVVYGFFAVIVVSPFLTKVGDMMNLTISSESALGAGVVMGIMILPFVSSLSEDVLSAIPNALKEASLGMGATLSETIKKILLPAATPGIIASLLLGVSRAIGETMLVVMAIGLTANLSFNPLASVTTVTVQIVSLLTGDQSFDSPASLSAFALGLTLFCMTLLLNMIALRVVKSYREKYEL